MKRILELEKRLMKVYEKNLDDATRALGSQGPDTTEGVKKGNSRKVID